MARVTLRVAYLALFLGLALAYYEFLGAGPTPSERAGYIPWWRPAGWARSLDWRVLKPLQEIGADTVQARHEGRFEPRSLIPLGLFAAPAALASAAGFALFRSVSMRAALLALGLTLCAFSYYGWLDLETWQDYSWRWPVVLLSTAGYLAVFALAPAIVRAAHARSAALRVAALLAFVLPIHVLSLEVTGTNPELAWNLSPWPTLTLFGFLLFGLMIGVIHVAAGLVVLGSIKLGQWHAERFLARARDEVAPQVIEALGRYHANHAALPRDLEELVPEEIAAIPRPRIGWFGSDDEVFTYTDLGESFLLEFPGPVWVQCAYSPPYEEEPEELEDAAAGGASEPEGEILAAAWSCESKPPRLW